MVQSHALIHESSKHPATSSHVRLLIWSTRVVGFWSFLLQLGSVSVQCFSRKKAARCIVKLWLERYCHVIRSIRVRAVTQCSKVPKNVFEFHFTKCCVLCAKEQCSIAYHSNKHLLCTWTCCMTVIYDHDHEQEQIKVLKLSKPKSE